MRRLLNQIKSKEAIVASIRMEEVEITKKLVKKLLTHKYWFHFLVAKGLRFDIDEAIEDDLKGSSLSIIFDGFGQDARCYVEIVGNEIYTTSIFDPSDFDKIDEIGEKEYNELGILNRCPAGLRRTWFKNRYEKKIKSLYDHMRENYDNDAFFDMC